MSVEFEVTGYAGYNHPNAKYGTVLLKTIHASESSAYVEVEAWRMRMRKQEASRVDLRDLRPGGRLSVILLHPDEPVNWSWTGK